MPRQAARAQDRDQEWLRLHRSNVHHAILPRRRTRSLLLCGTLLHGSAELTSGAE